MTPHYPQTPINKLFNEKTLKKLFSGDKIEISNKQMMYYDEERNAIRVYDNQLRLHSKTFFLDKNKENIIKEVPLKPLNQNQENIIKEFNLKPRNPQRLDFLEPGVSESMQTQRKDKQADESLYPKFSLNPSYPLARMPIRELIANDTFNELLNGETLRFGDYKIWFDEKLHAVKFHHKKSPFDTNSIFLDNQNKTIIDGFHLNDGDLTSHGGLHFLKDLYFTSRLPLTNLSLFPIQSEIIKKMPKMEPTDSKEKGSDNTSPSNLWGNTIEKLNALTRTIPTATGSPTPENRSPALPTSDLPKPATPDISNIRQIHEERASYNRGYIDEILKHLGHGELPGNNTPHIPKGRGH